jgi:FeS assembly SUF system regulator
MIRITRQTDYGIVLMTHMAGNPERWFNAPELAEEVRLPPPTVSKILKLLTREGLLLSHRGIKGGYSLARQPEEISMADVIACLEGPIAITECIDDATGCVHEPLCRVHGNWRRINEAVRTALAGISLAEMTHPLAARLVTLGGRRPLAGAAAAPQSH